MTEHPNSLLLHHCLQAVGAGDRETLRALWAEDIVWHVKGSSPWQGEIKGADEIFEYLADLGEVGEFGIDSEIEDVLVSNERAAVLFHSTADRGDRALDAGFMLIARIANRRIQSITSVPIDAQRVDAFWWGDGESE